MAKIKKIFLGVCFILISTSFIYSQKYGLPEIINFSNPTQEFSQEQVWQIKEAENGFLYFAANKYFLEYDGINWRVLKKNNSNAFNSFDFSSETIFLGLDNGIYSSTLSSTLFTMKQINSSMPVYNVWRTFYIDNKTYFFFNKKDAVVLNNNTLEFVKRPSNFNILRGFKVGSTIFATSKNGIAKIFENNIKIISHEYHRVYKEDIRTILDFDKNNFLLGTFRGNLWLMNKKDYKIKKLKTNIDSLLSESIIYFGTNYNDTTFILSTLNNGIFIISKSGKLLNHYNKNDGLPSNSIYYVYVDKSKNLWLGTAKGVCYIKYNSPIFTFDIRKKLNSKITFSGIYKDFLLTGTYENILKTNLKKNDDLKPISNLQYSDKFTIRKIKDKKYIIIGGYYKIEMFDSKLNFISNKNSSNKNIICPIPLDSSKFYIASNEGLSLWQLKMINNKPKIIKLKDLINLSFNISNIYFDKFNDLWISSLNMIFCIDFNYQSDSIREVIFDKHKGLPETKTYSIFETNKKIYFSTDSGLYYSNNFSDKSKKIIFNKNTSKINSIFSKSKIFAFAKNNQNFYFISDTGIIKSCLVLKHVETFNINALFDYQQSNISIYNDYLFINDNTKIYCINKSFRPFYEPNLKKQTLLRSYKISNEKTHFIYNSKDKFIKIENDSIYKFTKTFNSKNNIDFWFYSSVFSPNNNKYLFKIENDGNTWEELNSNKLSFRHLKAGKYIIKVKTVENNKENYQNLSIVFRVSPPIYLSIYAIIFYIIASIIIVFFIITSSVKIIRNQKNKLNILVKERTEQLEEMNEEVNSQTKLLKHQKSILEKETNRLKLAMIELQQLSLVAQKTDNSVLILEKNGKFEWWNRGFVDLFNYKLNKYKNLPLREAHLKIRPDIYKEINNYTIDKGTISYTSHESFENNDEIWYQTTINPIVDDNNELIKFVVIDTNITEIKNNETIIQNQNEINKLLKDKHNKLKSELSLKNENLKKYSDYDKLHKEYAKLLLSTFTYENHSKLSEFSDYFILDIPKENLSGDFLWINNLLKDEIFIAFGDASGHRVRGAITASIAMSIIKEIYMISPHDSVDNILNAFSEKMKIILNIENNTAENFNIALLKINKTTKNINFSSSRISLYLLRPESNYNFYKFNPNKYNIDTNQTKKFDIEKIKFHKKDRYYLTTDGWANQFGKFGQKKYSTVRIREFLLSIQDFDINSQETLIHAEINKWKGSFNQLDDILILGFEI